MAVYPKANYRPLGTQTEARLAKKHKVILHTMVGSLWGTDSYFRQEGFSGVESHFGVGGDGEVLQWQDTEYEADAQLQGNDDCISIETADHGPEFPSWSGSNVPSWTSAQLEEIAQIVAWVCKTHNIPCVLITDTEDSTKGVGYHRQGIDPYRTHGETYSNSFGKVCPGDRRVAQVPKVIERANEILNGEESLSWSEDLTPGTPGDDITPLAHSTLPETWGRSAADLLGYAAAAFAWLRNTDGVTDKVFNVDHVIPSPEAFYDHSDTNTHWTAARYLREMWEMLASLATLSDRMDALEAAIHGSSVDEIKDLIQQRYDAAAAERAALHEKLDSVSTTLNNVQTIVSNYQAGDIDETELVNELLRRLGELATSDAEGN